MSCVWQFMYRDLLQPGDSFPMMMRKMIIAFCPLIAIVPSILLILQILGIQRDTETGIYAAGFAILIGTWTVAKRTRTVSIWLFAFWSNNHFFRKFSSVSKDMNNNKETVAFWRWGFI